MINSYNLIRLKHVKVNFVTMYVSILLESGMVMIT